jgi:hypothetical protein
MALRYVPVRDTSPIMLALGGQLYCRLCQLTHWFCKLA